jgi:hypothetical protein
MDTNVISKCKLSKSIVSLQRSPVNSSLRYQNAELYIVLKTFSPVQIRQRIIRALSQIFQSKWRKSRSTEASDKNIRLLSRLLLLTHSRLPLFFFLSPVAPPALPLFVRFQTHLQI